MATKIFLFASTSFEFMCQWPFVTPMALGGAGCAEPAVVARQNASETAVRRFLMADPSSRWVFAQMRDIGANAITPARCTEDALRGPPQFDLPQQSARDSWIGGQGTEP